jgi:hypothetical protein
MGVLGRLGHGVFKLLTYAIIIVSIAFALHIGVESYQHYTPLCFSDSYSNGQVMTGRPAGAGACKSTWSCPHLLLCHGGRISGVAGLEEALSKVFGNSGSSSPMPPTVVSDETRSAGMEEPAQSEEGAKGEVWEEEGEDEWSEEGEEEEDWAEEWKADEHDAEHEEPEHANENDHEMEYGTGHENEEEHMPPQ